jgi:hypothetical protein
MTSAGLGRPGQAPGEAAIWAAQFTILNATLKWSKIRNAKKNN